MRAVLRRQYNVVIAAFDFDNAAWPTLIFRFGWKPRTGQVSGRRLGQLPGMSLLELHWWQVAQGRVQSARVINLTNELWETFNELLVTAIFIQVDMLGFECLHETFGFGVIARIAPPAHGSEQAIIGQSLAI
jgi:hypothetical protein